MVKVKGNAARPGANGLTMRGISSANGGPGAGEPMLRNKRIQKDHTQLSRPRQIVPAMGLEGNHPRPLLAHRLFDVRGSKRSEKGDSENGILKIELGLLSCSGLRNLRIGYSMGLEGHHSRPLSTQRLIDMGGSKQGGLTTLGLSASSSGFRYRQACGFDEWGVAWAKYAPFPSAVDAELSGCEYIEAQGGAHDIGSLSIELGLPPCLRTSSPPKRYPTPFLFTSCSSLKRV